MFDFSALSGKGMIVTFIKKDGTERVMRCTTNLNNIPSEKHPKGTGTGSTSTVRKVFDLDKQEWRCFRYDSVIKAVPLD